MRVSRLITHSIFRPSFSAPISSSYFQSTTRWYSKGEKNVDPEILKILQEKGINAEDLYEMSDAEDSVQESDKEDYKFKSKYVDDADGPFSSSQLEDITPRSRDASWLEEGGEAIEVDPDTPSAYDLVLEKFEEEDPHFAEKDLEMKVLDFCPKALKKWVDDAVGALVGKGFYDHTGKWVQYNKLDKKLDPMLRERIQEKPPIPPLTFRVVSMPEGQEGFSKRAYDPPKRRTRLPADLQGRYRFGIPNELVEELDLSEKLRSVLSFEYATNTEIRRARLEDAVKKWGKAANDCGNTCVQLAMITQKIRYLEEHLKVHRKDHCAKRRLQITIANRRNLFKYLKRKDVTGYYALLKDQVVEDKFLMHKNE